MNSHIHLSRHGSLVSEEHGAHGQDVPTTCTTLSWDIGCQHHIVDEAIDIEALVSEGNSGESLRDIVPDVWAATGNESLSSLDIIINIIITRVVHPTSSKTHSSSCSSISSLASKVEWLKSMRLSLDVYGEILRCRSCKSP